MKKNHVENKRETSTKAYVDSLQDKYSKLNVVRVDLGYKKPHSDRVVLGDANKDLNHMLNNRRGKLSIFEHQVGYICKKEYTEDKGVHFHTVFFYNGQKVKNDVIKAKQIGEYWNEAITKNKGSYHSCNLNADKVYGKKNAVGMLDHTDKDRREKLDKAISYLCKDDEKQDIAPVKTNARDKSFVRGIIQKPKSKVGRPRNKVSKDQR